MKIMQVIPDLYIAGAEIMCENLIYALSDMGHDIVCVSQYTVHTEITDRLEEKGIKVIYLDKKLGFDLSMYKKMRDLVKAEKPDIIHTHRNSLKYVIHMHKKVKHIIHTVHNVADKEVGKLDQIVHKFAFKKLGVIPISLSDNIRDTIINLYDIPDSPIILNGINIDSYEMKDSYNLHRPINILHIGRFAEQKNHKTLIEAFKIFNDAYPNSKLTLLGDGPLFDEINDKVHELDLVGKVDFLGVQNDVRPYLKKADIFTLPSLYEGVPMSLIEAMASALPIVCTNVGGVSDMLKHMDSAIFVENSPGAICEGFSTLIQDMDLREKLGKMAYVEAMRFSSINMARKYVSVYER